jgi:hypothetical protein
VLDCSVMRWIVFALKWSLVALGAFVWIMLWWSRSPWLGMAQVVLIGAALLREGWPHLRRQRGDNALRRPGHTSRTS